MLRRGLVGELVGEFTTDPDGVLFVFDMMWLMLSSASALLNKDIQDCD